MAERPNTRRFSRIAFHRPGTLELRTVRGECEVLDVSLKGALVNVGPTLRPVAGETCALVIRLDGGDAHIRFEGEVAHVAGQRVGVKCDELDLESIQHLRQIVELHLGDEALLHRELAALVAERDW
jgi:PilZ domain